MKYSIKPFYFLIVTIILSCNSNQSLPFSVAPKIAENPNKAAPLTAYLGFETDHPIDSVFVEINDGERETKLKFHRKEKRILATF